MRGLGPLQKDALNKRMQAAPGIIEFRPLWWTVSWAFGHSGSCGWGILGFGHLGIQEIGSLGILDLGIWGFGGMGNLDICEFYNSESWECGICDLRILGCWEFGKSCILDFGKLEILEFCNF